MSRISIATAPAACAAALAALLASPAAAQDAPAQTAPTNSDPTMASGTAAFIDAEGASLGTADLTATPHGVLIALEMSSLPPEGWVAFHIHEGTACDPGERFETAGGHFNPNESDHGFMVDTGPHAGDMPNQWVDSDGNLRSEVFNTFVTLGDGAPGDVSGRVLMLHAEPDDYESQPAGGAGERLACAVIE